LPATQGSFDLTCRQLRWQITGRSTTTLVGRLIIGGTTPAALILG
jgi:hypothetical protein